MLVFIWIETNGDCCPGGEQYLKVTSWFAKGASTFGRSSGDIPTAIDFQVSDHESFCISPEQPGLETIDDKS
jgi:hypothetical protein